MQSSEMVSRATEILAATVSRGSAADGMAARALTDLVYQKLWHAGYAGAWEDFVRNPANDSLIRYLLQQAAAQDPDFWTRVDELARAATIEPARNSDLHFPGSAGPAEIAISSPADAFNDRAPLARRNYPEDEVINDHRVTHRARRKSHTRTYVVLAAALAILGLEILGR